MTDSHSLFHPKPTDDLFRTPFLTQQRFNVLPDFVGKTWGRLVVSSRKRQIMGLLWPIAPQSLLAENANQALELLAKHEDIDILFSDIVMPGGVNGVELVQRAIERKPELKVLITSGFTSKIIARNLSEKLSKQLLSKPYRKTELAHRIRLVLDEEE